MRYSCVIYPGQCTIQSFHPSLPDPAPHQSVTATAKILPAIAGNQVDFRIVGTDGYSNSASPLTNDRGEASCRAGRLSVGVARGRQHRRWRLRFFGSPVGGDSRARLGRHRRRRRYNPAMARPSLMTDFVHFLKHEKLYWMVPLGLVVLAVLLVLLFGESSPVVDFLYPLF